MRLASKAPNGAIKRFCGESHWRPVFGWKCNKSLLLQVTDIQWGLPIPMKPEEIDDWGGCCDLTNVETTTRGLAEALHAIAYGYSGDEDWWEHQNGPMEAFAALRNVCPANVINKDTMDFIDLCENAVHVCPDLYERERLDVFSLRAAVQRITNIIPVEAMA